MSRQAIPEKPAGEKDPKAGTPGDIQTTGMTEQDAKEIKELLALSREKQDQDTEETEEKPELPEQDKADMKKMRKELKALKEQMRQEALKELPKKLQETYAKSDINVLKALAKELKDPRDGVQTPKPKDDEEKPKGLPDDVIGGLSGKTGKWE